MKKILLLSLAVFAAAALSVRAETVTVLTSANRLLTIDSAMPTEVTRTVVVSGLADGETLLGIDYRPAVGTLYGLGSSSRIYSIDTETGVATAVGQANVFALQGTSFGFDFNPVPDRIRITSDADQNLRVNPNDGTFVTDGTLAFAAGDPNAGANPNVVASAYVNSFANAGATTLYNIDSNLDALLIQNPPNAGTLVTVGSLGVDTSDRAGFDISGKSGIAYAALTVGGVTNLYTINLLSGAATLVGPISTTSLVGETIVDIAVGVNPGARLRNLSARGRVGDGEDALIGGFIVQGGHASRYVIRGIGPSLAQAGVANPLMDPVVTVFNENGDVIAMNDDFGPIRDSSSITTLGLGPQDDREAAVLLTLPAGSGTNNEGVKYTAHVTGKNGAAGVALIEIYELP